jgi:hypothetical protein
MTANIFVNGRPAGMVQSTPGGALLVSHDSWDAIAHFPVTVFPFLDPNQFLRVLHGLRRETLVPGFGVIRVEVHQ